MEWFSHYYTREYLYLLFNPLPIAVQYYSTSAISITIKDWLPISLEHNQHCYPYRPCSRSVVYNAEYHCARIPNLLNLILGFFLPFFRLFRNSYTGSCNNIHSPILFINISTSTTLHSVFHSLSHEYYLFTFFIFLMFSTSIFFPSYNSVFLFILLKCSSCRCVFGCMWYLHISAVSSWMRIVLYTWHHFTSSSAAPATPAGTAKYLNCCVFYFVVECFVWLAWWRWGSVAYKH